MPDENEIHECEALKLESRYLDYVCAGRNKARWRLIWVNGPNSCDEVVLQRVLFCPGCGQDFREDTGASYPGKPNLTKVLLQLGCKRQ